MKKILTTVFYLLILVFFARSQTNIAKDSLEIIKHHKEKNTEQKTYRKEKRKQIDQHFRIAIVGTYADINSMIRFEAPGGLISAQLDFERHLGLEEKKFIYSGSFIYRITPRSGLFALSYRLHRKSEYELKRDISFLGDTIKKGALISGYFNTQVLSIGYLLTLLETKKSFLGAYFNMYVIKVDAGVYSDVFHVNKSTGLFTPLPNFGILAIFQLKKWIALSGGVGIFFLNVDGMNGSFHDAHALIEFSPTKWLSLSFGYYLFDVDVGWPVGDFRAYAEYNFQGPSVGLNFRF